MVQGLTRREREITDIEEIIKILEKENIIHIGRFLRIHDGRLRKGIT